MELPTPAGVIAERGHAALERAPVRPAGSRTAAATPPVRRTPIAPAAWRGDRTSVRPGNARLARTAMLRRATFSVLVLAQTAVFAYCMVTKVLPYHGRDPLEVAILALSAILFVWISFGFWTALSGFVLLCAGRDRYAITRSASPADPIAPGARTAVVMPICNEHVSRVFAGLRATYESVAATGDAAHFDFFVLSDSSEPDTLTAERNAWHELCAAVGGFGRIFYRWRAHHIKRKSGNVADFCRRWGSQYRYMIVLDADSVMSGRCLGMLVRLIEANPTTGIIQTAPIAAGRDTLYARIQQFAGCVYGPLFTAGLHFWQLDEAPYWGHNAIIRLAPFMRHCALGRLRGRGPFCGEILSHDFVEAALMRRAGWEVWMAHDLPGSYEEVPPNLIDELRRDRRWCVGNLINSRVFLWRGLHTAHRAVFATGIMTYVSAPLWLLYLKLATAFVVLEIVVGPRYFAQPYQLFPTWPEWDVHAAIGFAIGTAAVLFVPKILAAALLVARGARAFGGVRAVALGLVLEILFSAVLAPIRMLFHTHFVIGALIGWRLQWKSPPREDSETTWGEAIRRHGVHTMLGAAWAAGMYWLAPTYAWWCLPLAGSLTLSIPVSVFSSRVSLGRRLRRAKIFMTPEEAEPPTELASVRRHVADAIAAPRFVDAVVDPETNAIVGAASPSHARRARAAAARRALIAAALAQGPDGLTDEGKRLLLADRAALAELHHRVWSSPTVHPGWRVVSAAAARHELSGLRAAS